MSARVCSRYDACKQLEDPSCGRVCVKINVKTTRTHEIAELNRMRRDWGGGGREFFLIFTANLQQ